ncbi:MAG: HEAT repeat domain-containing protein [Acidobacteriota bacterium]|jgi:HEAT repeat protein
MEELQEKDPVSEEPEPLLDEEDDRPTFLVIAQFFLIPLVVISVCVGLFFFFGLMTGESRDAGEYLAQVRAGSKARRFQAAYELSKLLAYDEEASKDPAFVRELARVFTESRGAEPELRRYLALALGQVADPSTLDALLEALDDPDPQTRIYTLWAIGAVGDPRAVPALIPVLADPDPGVRKTAAFALGSLRDAAAAPSLAGLLDDPVVDVRWNAALALAQIGDPAGRQVLRSMLDRDQLGAVDGITPAQQSEAMISASRALALIGGPGAQELLERVADSDPDLEVRAAAGEAAEFLRDTSAPS